MYNTNWGERGVDSSNLNIAGTKTLILLEREKEEEKQKKEKKRKKENVGA